MRSFFAIVLMIMPAACDETSKPCNYGEERHRGEYGYACWDGDGSESSRCEAGLRCKLETNACCRMGELNCSCNMSNKQPCDPGLTCVEQQIEDETYKICIDADARPEMTGSTGEQSTSSSEEPTTLPFCGEYHGVPFH